MVFDISKLFEMDDFVQRMVQRFQNQVYQKMSLEKRTRKLTIMKALAQNSFKIKNKENENPLNNNLALPINFTHSTPIKSQRNTNMNAADDSETTFENDLGKPKKQKEEEEGGEEPELVIAKIYDLESRCADTLIEEKENDINIEDFEIEITPSKMKGNHLNVLTNEHKQWKSQEFLQELDASAEYEFCRSLEQSKLYLSTSNLLEEIEADLPSSYSLARPLNHTLHTISSYRTLIRLNRMDGNTNCPKDLEPEFSVKNKMASKKVSSLEMEATVQKSIVEQTEKALRLSRSQKSMETENLEKTLLLAGLRYNAALQEIERLRTFGDFSEENFGQITIFDAAFHLCNAKGYLNDLFICTATNKENLQFTLLLKEISTNKLHFQQPLKFQKLNKDFAISIEVYTKEIKEGKIPMKTSIVKKLKELATMNGNKNLTNNIPSNHGFVCLARAELRLEQVCHCKKNICTLKYSEPPQYPIVGPTVGLMIKTDVNLSEFKYSGFLNVFKHTWQRCWFFQSGHFLDSWLYPEDQENDKPPIHSIYLGNRCARVEIADIEFCVRAHSFVLILGSKLNEEKILFSADSQKDMIKWMDHLNSIFNQIRLWAEQN